MEVRYVMIIIFILYNNLCIGCDGSPLPCGPEHPNEGSCPSGQECRFGACVVLRGDADVQDLVGDLGAVAYLTVFPNGTSRWSASIMDGAACHSIPPDDTDFLSIEFSDSLPVGIEIEKGGDHFISASFRSRDELNNELATSLRLRLDKFETEPEGEIQGKFDATFPLTQLDGTFNAYICPPL